jgi:hypothetical protein
MTSRWIALQLRCDARRFAGARGDYYGYLADLVEAVDGRKTLRDIFADDARRYGEGCVRGRLSRHWASAFEACGGDVARAWAGTLPVDELQLLHAAQGAGAGAFCATLRDLSRTCGLLDDVRGTLVGTLAAGVVAAILVGCMACAVAYFTVPQLQAVFQGVPAHYYGASTRRLFCAAVLLRNAWPAGLAGLCIGCWMIAWSLPNLVGAARARLDRLPFLRLYRDFHGIRFLSILSVLVRQRGNVDTRLREALLAQAAGARPWLAWHVQAMLTRIEAGLVSAETFATGLLDQEVQWYLDDLISARGLESGIATAASRVQDRVLPRVRREALVLRWALLCGAVAALLGLAMWHYAVIDELRRALIHFHSGG